MEINNYFKNMHIKKTVARVAILEILTKKESALSVEYIYNECLSRKMKIDISTVYRTLELFEMKDIVKKFDLGDSKYSYIINKSSHKHILQCKYCGCKVEIDCPMQQVEESIKSSTGFTISEDELKKKIMGVCKSCRSSNKKA